MKKELTSFECQMDLDVRFDQIKGILELAMDNLGHNGSDMEALENALWAAKDLLGDSQDLFHKYCQLVHEELDSDTKEDTDFDDYAEELDELLAILTSKRNADGSVELSLEDGEGESDGSEMVEQEGEDLEDGDSQLTWTIVVLVDKDEDQ